MDFRITKADIDKYFNKKKPAPSRIALSKQATLENAMNNRQPQNPNAPAQMPAGPASDGFGRTI